MGQSICDREMNISSHNFVDALSPHIINKVEGEMQVETYLIAGLILSALIGITLGLIGGGGSTITVPVLVYVMGIEAHQAIGMSLAIVGMTSLIGTGLHYWQGTVRLKTGYSLAYPV